MVYAILDTQSDATFILKETCDELDAKTQPTKLRWSTITSQDSLVDSQRVSGLQVRGYNSDVKIHILVAFTSTPIPAEEEHIPTKATAKNWEHSRSIEGKMHALFDCNVGLLTGYDCSQALTPREVLAGGNNEPYGIKTDLGWSIVGGSDVRSRRSLCHKVAVSNVGLLTGCDCSQALTPREVLAGGNNEPYGIKTDLGWSIVGGSDVRSRRSLCHKVAVRELPGVTMTDIVRVLESDFQGAKDDKKTSQEDLNFLKIMEEGIEKTGKGHFEMPLPFKERPLLPDNHSMALIRLEHLKRKFLKDSKYKEDYVKF